LSTFERNISQLEEQLEATLNAAERERLLRLLIREIRKFAQNEKFCPSLEWHIVARAERIKTQRALVAHLKGDGHEARNAQFLLVTLLTMQALSLHRYAIARQTLKPLISYRPALNTSSPVPDRRSPHLGFGNKM
jgi:hypothetical protein